MNNLSAFLIIFFAGSTTAATTKCNADNCARAVTGTLRAQTSSHLADCSSFQRCTVTPANSTSTVFSTIYLPRLLPIPYTENPAADTTASSQVLHTGNPSRPENKRQASATATTRCPTAVPAYASPCSGSARYASACSCYGASPTTTTLATPVTTETYTITLPLPPSF